MSTETEQVSTARKVQIPGFVARAGYFLLHFLEMCVVMCIGAGILSALSLFVGGLLGYPRPTRQFPELATVVLGFYLALVMIAWMRFRGHEWRPTLEMASSSVVVLIPLMGAAWFGAIPKLSLLKLECFLACAFMIVPMVLRLDHYTGHHHAGHQHQALAPNTVNETSCH